MKQSCACCFLNLGKENENRLLDTDSNSDSEEHKGKEKYAATSGSSSGSGRVMLKRTTTGGSNESVSFYGAPAVAAASGSSSDDLLAPTDSLNSDSPMKKYSSVEEKRMIDKAIERRESVTNMTYRRKKKKIKKRKSKKATLRKPVSGEYKHKVAMQCLRLYIGWCVFYCMVVLFNMYKWSLYYDRREDDDDWYDALVEKCSIDFAELSMITLFRKVDIIVFAFLFTHLYLSVWLFTRLGRGNDDKHPLVAGFRRTQMSVGSTARTASAPNSAQTSLMSYYYSSNATDKYIMDPHRH